MQNKTFIIHDDQINSLYEMAEEIHANVSLLKLFCKEYYECEDIYKIKPILDYTYHTSDLLYAELINIRYNSTT